MDMDWDESEQSSDSEHLDIIGKFGYRDNIENIFHTRRKICDTSESELDEVIERTYLPEANPQQLLWTKENLTPKIHKFDTNVTGMKLNIDGRSSILEVFQLFFSEQLVDYIVNETNNYSSTKSSSSEHTRLNRWKDTTVNEMYRFLAASMLMERLQILSLREHWSTDELLQNDSIRKIMKKDRYHSLLKMLRFCKSSNSKTNEDPLAKVRSIIDSLRDSFSRSFYPYQYLYIDESLLIFKDQLSSKQRALSRPKKFGIKFIVLCDCQTGYIQDFSVHNGASTEITDDRHSVEIEKSENIVMSLMQPYLHKGHTLITHNRITDPSLYLLLHQNKTNAFGTMKKNRCGIPHITDKLHNGEFTFCSTDQLLTLKWMDMEEMIMLSSCHSAELVKTKKRNCKTGKLIKKPSVIADYEVKMKKIDKAEDILNSIHIDRKPLKWYKELFFHILDLSIYNAYVLYKIVSDKKITFAKFFIQLIREILQKYPANVTINSGGISASKENLFRLVSRHFPSKYTNPAATRQNGRRKCVVCAKHKKRTETRYQCRDCNVGLCIDPCFKLYHTEKDY